MSSLAGSPAPEAAQRLHGPVSMGRDFAHELERAKHAVKRRLKRIRRDAAAGKKIAHRRDLHLRKRSTALVALADARAKLLKTKNRGRRERRQPLLSLSNIATDSHLLELADNLDLWAPCDEIAFASYISKPGGGRREIVNFELLNRARQIMMKEVLDRQFIESSGQFTRKGRHKACAAVKDDLERGDAKWAVITDIRDHFGSITQLQVEDTAPLPRGLVPMLMKSAYNIVPRQGHNHHSTPEVNGGSHAIPQGSSASPLVAAFTIKSLLEAVNGEGCCVRNYADNFLGLAKTHREASMIHHTLIDTARRQHGSRLDFHHTQVRRLDHGFEFCGYHFRKKGGKVSARPIQRRLDEFRFTTEMLIALDRPIQEIRTYVNSWCEQFRLADGVKAMRENLLRRAEDHQRLSSMARGLVCLAHLTKLFRKNDRRRQRLARQHPRDEALQMSVSGSHQERLSRFIREWIGEPQ